MTVFRFFNILNLHPCKYNPTSNLVDGSKSPLADLGELDKLCAISGSLVDVELRLPVRGGRQTAITRGEVIQQVRGEVIHRVRREVIHHVRGEVIHHVSIRSDQTLFVQHICIGQYNAHSIMLLQIYY